MGPFRSLPEQTSFVGDDAAEIWNGICVAGLPLFRCV
jgi:hypothetical protein